MPSLLETARRGYRFPDTTYHLSPQAVSAYVSAVEDGAIDRLGDIVPPLEVAALSVSALLDRTVLPPGALHVGQELSFHRSVRVGERLLTRLDITSRGERQGWVLMGISVAVTDESGGLVMTGRAMLSFPTEAS